MIMTPWSTFLTFKHTIILNVSGCPLDVACSLCKFDMEVIGSILAVCSHLTNISIRKRKK